MSELPPGRTVFSAHVFLENRCTKEGQDKILFFDSKIYSAKFMEGSHEIICRFHYYVPFQEPLPLNGLYDITGRVKLSLPIIITN